MVTAITEAVISTVNGVGRILYLRPFNEHVGTSVTDGPNIQDIVRGSRAFRTTSADIGDKVEADFAEAEVRSITAVRSKISSSFSVGYVANCLQTIPPGGWMQIRNPEASGKESSGRLLSSSKIDGSTSIGLTRETQRQKIVRLAADTLGT